MDQIEISKPVGIAIAGVVACVLAVGLWMRAGAQTAATGRVDAQQTIAAQESQEFQRTPPPTVGGPDGRSAGDRRD